MIYNVQGHLNPRWRLVIDRDACVAFWKQTQRGSLLWIYLCKPFLFTISLGEVMLMHYSRQFGDNFQDLVSKMNLVALAPVLGAISHPVN